jgi:recombination protein RecR
MEEFNRLIELFRQFPGIGPRQAKRFAYFILSKESVYADSLSKLITGVRKASKECASCHRFFHTGTANSLCSICLDKTRDKNVLMIVSRDVDLEVVEKSGAYKGMYFVLGGTIPILDKEPDKKIRLKELLALVKKMTKEGLKEIILALNANSEGENTGDFLVSHLSPISEGSFKITILGRGLSTGTELEYADADTFKNALKHRE